MSEPLLEVRNLKKYFPVKHGMFSSGKGFVHAVDGISLTVEKGETFGLVGESGCGKSSLSRVILGLVKRDSGDILYKGQDIKTMDRAQRSKLRMVFQNPFASLNPKEKVFDIIAEPYRIAGKYSSQQIEQEVLRLLDLVGLSRGYAGRYPHEFSGGQRQRIGIARSVIMRPEMIIADEPISALDVSIQAQVINLLNELREKLGLTILFIAHDLSVVKYFSDRIGVMYFGKMVELASSDELFAHPLHPYTRSLLSAIPLPDPHYEKQRVRITYNPLVEHDYSVNKPSMREVAPGHFVYCNDEEEEKYKKQLQL